MARIVATHGIRGEVKAVIITDFPERFARLNRAVIGEDDRTYEVEATRLHKGMVLLKMGGVDTCDDADALRGAMVRVPIEEAVPLEPDSYYWHQIIGLRAVTPQGEPLGEVVDILQLPANDVYVVKGPDGELLIPAVEDYVLSINPAEGTMVVERPEYGE